MESANGPSLLIAVDKLLEYITKGLEFTNAYDPLSDLVYKSTKYTSSQILNWRHHLRVEGSTNIPAQGGVILACNHQSWLDVFALGAAAPRRVFYVAKGEFANWPLVRHGVRFAGSIFVNRSGDQDALSQIVDTLSANNAIAIFPEGTIPGEENTPRRKRDKLTGLLPGKTGAVRLAIRSGAPIVPVGISGTGKTLPPEMWPRKEFFKLPPPNPITIRFGKPIYVNEYSMDNIDNNTLHRLTEHMMVSISDLIDHQSNFMPLVVPAPKGSKYERLGILVLHEFGSELHSLEKIRPSIEAAGLAHAMPVLRGHGTRYQDLIGVEARDWYVDSEHALIRLWETTDKVAVVGISMGGLLGLELGVRHPDKIACVVTVAAPIKFKEPIARFAKQLSGAIRFWSPPDYYTDESLRTPKSAYEKLPVETFASLYDYSRRVKDLLPLFHVPIRVLHSKADTIISPVSANIIYSDVSSRVRELFWYTKTNHFMLTDLESKKVIEDIMEFVLSFQKEAHES